MTIYLVTGGAGSLGRHLATSLLQKPEDVIRVFDNHENSLVRLRIMVESEDPSEDRLRYFLGDVRDKDRVLLAMDGVDVCIHAAAQKHVDVAEYNPFESILTNVLGTQNCVNAALAKEIDRFLYISSDKAVQAISTYGRCKALSESLTLDANNYKGDKRTKFSVARPPNYVDSDGNVFQIWEHYKQKGLPLPVTHPEMTRYFIHLPDIIDFIKDCLAAMEGGEIFVPAKAEKMRIIDLARNISKDIKVVGMRKGERLHELLMNAYEKKRAKRLDDLWIIR